MKTLDEVIHELEGKIACETHVGLRDALHYLKNYKKDQEDPDGDHQQMIKAQKLLGEFFRNDPLTWDELRTMTGKPVWWAHGEVGEWLTIYRVPSLGNGNDNVIYATTCSGVECWIWRKDLDKFQYYRKERE